MFKGFKVVGVVCGVVACKDNNKVGGCSDAVLLAVAVARLLWECGFLVGLEDRERGWKKRENPHAGFTQIKTTHF